MERLVLYGDVLSLPDFASVRTQSAVQEAAHALDAILRRRIGHSDVAFTIHEKMFVPEGVAYDPLTKAFFVSSQYQRKIVRIDAAGAVTTFADRSQGLWTVLGMAVDPTRRVLWAVSTAEPQMAEAAPADENRTGVFGFDLKTGTLAHRFVFDAVKPPHRFDDLAVTRTGRVFISDGGSGAIYTVASGDPALRVFVPPGTIQGPNGIAPSPDGHFIFVSDYAGFIFRIDTSTAEAIRLDAPPDVALYGIDGLAWTRGALIGVQNGVEPARVVRLAVDPEMRRVTDVTIIDMGHPSVAEPTLGVVVGDTYYYVANSHGALLRKPDSVLADQPLTDPVILKLDLHAPID